MNGFKYVGLNLVLWTVAFSAIFIAVNSALAFYYATAWIWGW